MRIKASGPKNEPENLIYHAMVKRCHDPNDKHYDRYGGRGITVCQRWLDDWRAFITDVGKRPDPSFVLDRIDNNRGYEPGNVHWVTRRESSANREVTIRITHDGRTQTLADWAREVGLRTSTLNSRIARGWTAERALFEAARDLPWTKKKRRAA